jgi:methylphosphotriester-DNA--protein-cysteine methyltransferase
MTRTGKYTWAEKRSLLNSIRAGEFAWAGNKRLKIFGTLQCTSGQRMASYNRVFFHSKEQALQQGYRPCGHCLKTDYQLWKRNNV